MLLVLLCRLGTETTAREGACGAEPRNDLSQENGAQPLAEYTENQAHWNVVRPPGTSSRWAAMHRANAAALAAYCCRHSLVQNAGDTGSPRMATQAQPACVRDTLLPATPPPAAAASPLGPGAAPRSPPRCF